MTILGIDVSHWNPEPLPWVAWQGRVSVVGIKLTNDVVRDVQASRHLAAARAAGYTTLFGYHYLEPMWGAQSAAFLAALGPEFQFAMLDIEEVGLTEPIMRMFCDHYDAHETRPLVLYGNSRLLTKLIAQNPARYARYKVVWAEYGPNLPTSTPPYAAARSVPPGIKLAGWQFAGEGGRLPPWPGALDLTEWYEVPGGTPVVVPPPADNGAIAKASRLIDEARASLKGLVA